MPPSRGGSPGHSNGHGNVRIASLALEVNVDSQNMLSTWISFFIYSHMQKLVLHLLFSRVNFYTWLSGM